MLIAAIEMSGFPMNPARKVIISLAHHSVIITKLGMPSANRGPQFDQALLSKLKLYSLKTDDIQRMKMRPISSISLDVDTVRALPMNARFILYTYP